MSQTERINSYLLCVALMALSFLSTAQTGLTGVYKTAEDFLKGHLSHAGRHTKLRTHDTFQKERFVVKTHDSTFSYLKKDLFGYQTKDGQNFRLFETRIYPTLNPTESILIYVINSGTGMRNSPFSEQYYFSRTASSNILPLTIQALEKAFADHVDFINLLAIYFKSSDSLLEYDHIHQIYKINRLYGISLSKTLNKIN